MGTMGTHGSYVFGKKMMSRTAQVRQVCRRNAARHAGQPTMAPLTLFPCVVKCLKKMINCAVQVSDFGFCMLDNWEDFELYEPESDASAGSDPSPAGSSNNLAESGAAKAEEPSGEAQPKEGSKASTCVPVPPSLPQHRGMDLF